MLRSKLNNLFYVCYEFRTILCEFDVSRLNDFIVTVYYMIMKMDKLKSKKKIQVLHIMMLS